MIVCEHNLFKYLRIRITQLSSLNALVYYHSIGTSYYPL